MDKKFKFGDKVNWEGENGIYIRPWNESQSVVMFINGNEMNPKKTKSDHSLVAPRLFDRNIYKGWIK